MKIKRRVMVVMAAATCLWLAGAIETVRAADTYEMDKAHSAVMFKAMRMGIVNVYGRFNEASGSITADEGDIGASSVEIEIKTGSVDTGNQGRDNHLRSPDFFNAKQFPVIKFKSTSVKKTGEASFEVTGDLSLHGVTKPITAEVKLIGRGEDRRRGSKLIGFETTFTVKRSDFGMKFMVGPLGDEIEVTLAMQAVGK